LSAQPKDPPQLRLVGLDQRLIDACHALFGQPPAADSDVVVMALYELFSRVGWPEGHDPRPAWEREADTDVESGRASFAGSAEELVEYLRDLPKEAGEGPRQGKAASA
jgi:hypothetical protein